MTDSLWKTGARRSAKEVMPSWPSREAMDMRRQRRLVVECGRRDWPGGRRRGCWPCRCGCPMRSVRPAGRPRQSRSSGARGGTDSRPICQARSASMRSPLSIRCIAAGLPTAAGSRWVPPNPGMQPIRASGSPNWLRSEATTQVAREHQLEAAAEREPVDAGDDRHGRRRDGRHRSMSGVDERLGLDDAQPADLLEVGARAERALTGAADDDARRPRRRR